MAVLSRGGDVDAFAPFVLASVDAYLRRPAASRVRNTGPAARDGDKVVAAAAVGADAPRKPR